MQYIDAKTVKDELTSGSEIALLDIREYGQYGEGHPFFAVNLPYSILEIGAIRLLPGQHAHCVLLDDDDGLAETAARRLTALGLQNISILRGGVRGWEEAGFTLFKGVNLPSKAYGEIVEHELGTPSISALELAQLLEQDHAPLVLDGRTPAEFEKMNIPHAQSLPNAEIGHRLGAFVANDSQTIIVNCAGRTRSILGAQTLRQLEVTNPVYALRNGTAGWALAGLKLLNGTKAVAPATLSESLKETSSERARLYRQKYKIPTMDLDELAEIENDSMRSCYRLDVRTIEEYQRGHLIGSIHAPGGQLVQATDQWIAVRGAKVVLIDDTGLRASTTAGWLRNMGHDATVLACDISQYDGVVSGSGQHLDTQLTAYLDSLPAVPFLTINDVSRKLTEAVTVIDFSSGMQYRRSHIDGAHWGIRPRISELATALKISGNRPLLLCGADQNIRALAAIELRELGYTALSQFDGNIDDFRKHGLTISESSDVPSNDDCIDYLFFVHDRHDGNLEASQQYLDWETGLLAQVDDQERSVFRT